MTERPRELHFASDRPHSKLFDRLSSELLEGGHGIRFVARGASMFPAIRDGETVHIRPARAAELRIGQIVLVKAGLGVRLHRLVLADAERDVYITRGDCGDQDDPAVSEQEIVGIAVAKEVRVGRKICRAEFCGIPGRCKRVAARAQFLLTRLRTALLQKWSRARNILGGAERGYTSVLLLVFALLAGLPVARAQVAVNATTFATSEVTGAGTTVVSFKHTAAGANRLVIIGVSMNITNAPTSAVTSVTYGGVALTFLGAHNDAANTRRAEMWYLLAPATTHNATINVSVQVPVAAATVGVVVGATTFTGVDQTVPVSSFVSADGAAGAYAQMDVPSVINGMVLDTLATGASQTVTVSGPQVSQWNTTSGGTDPPDVAGEGSSRTGAPSVPISETFNGTSNWSLGAVSINPTSADIGVSTSVNAVPLGQNSVFTITVSNSGPSAANTVKLTDKLGTLTALSVTTTSGTCTGTGTSTVNCTLATPFASGATATITVTAKAATAGFYPNTATVTDSGTPPDPNTGNDTYVALAPVVSVVCSTTVLTDGGTLSGVLNTYYPGTASVTAGSKSIPVGGSTGAGGTIVSGSLLLVIQMQDASINTSNTVAYGNGYTGQGFTTINNAGNYEFVTATGPVSGGSVPVSGAGGGGGLVFGYTSAAASNTAGQSAYQVVLVPQYLSATFSSTSPPTAPAWNGSTGGVLALDIAGALNLNGATVSVDGLGFRGGAGLQLTGGTGAATDYLAASPTAYTGVAEAGDDAAKGEGVAGTPEWVESGGTYLQTTTTIGYPSGGANDGSMARGAPGNAGGGATDAHPSANDQNAGGGGGGNGGSGGFGGDSWNTNLSTGGEGGGSFPATIDRIAMGGGGGAGTRNNSNGDTLASSGAAGGGVIFLRVDSFTGTGTLTANGASAYNGTANDGGGGGGAGGTIVALAANGGESGLTLSAQGGVGGDAWHSNPYTLANRHGPGGGGGGGVVYVSGTAASINVTGGVNGTTETPGVPYGATTGANGVSATNNTLSQVTGIQSSSLCSPDLTLTKSHTGNFTRGGTPSYTITVSNVSLLGVTSGLVTMNDTLPLGLAPLSATGTGWSCSVSGQTVSCLRSDSLGIGASYPPITLTASVLQSAPAMVTNTAEIGGGGEANLLNDFATDVASVVSSADITVTDAGSPNPVAAGSNITYTQIVTNTGPSAADNATLATAVPANTTFVSIAAPAGWSCIAPLVGGTGSVVCTSAAMTAVSSATITMVVKVNAATTNGTVISQSVTVGSSAIDSNSSNNSASVTTIVGTSAPNLSVTNVASPNPVQSGNNITYTQIVTNTGSTPITNGTFSEATPSNTTLLSITPPAGWSCSSFPASPCTATNVAGGTSGTFTVIYKTGTGLGNGTVITDTVTVNASNQSFGPNSATATDVIESATQALLTLTTAAAPSTVLAGNNITYTQTIGNSGPAAATSVSFNETTPTNTTYQSVLAPAGWTCTTPAVGSTGTVNCTNPSLAAGAEADIVVVVNVPSTVTASSISETATVSASNAALVTATAVTPVSDQCDLTVMNSGSPSPVSAGSNITYTQTVYNHGPSNCSTAVMSEATPANTTFVSVGVVTTGGGTWTCPNSAPVSCTNPSVPPGSTGTITAIYTVNAGTAAGTIISDTVTGTTTTRDTNTTDNSATLNIAVATAGQADLSVTNSASSLTVTAGNNITYTQSVTNAGPATANAPVFTETLPANTTAVSLTGPAGWTCVLATLTCTDTTTMAAATTANFSFVVTVSATVAQGTAITQTDSVSSTTGDPNGGNNSATVTVYVGTSADLSVTNTPSPTPVIAGNNITYTQVVTNAGPSAAANVSLTNTLPANTTAVSLSGPAGWTCTLATFTCTNPSLAAGAPATITYVVTVNVGTAAGTPINETANVTSTIADPNTSNNTAVAADVVATAAQADLVMTNSALPTTVTAGSNVAYTQTVTNNGPATGTSATFTENTPPNTNYQSITIPSGWTCPTLPTVGAAGTISCNDGNPLGIGSANASTFTVVLQVNSDTPSGTYITDTATSSASNIVPGITTNTASATIVVANANSADVAIVKTATPNPVTEGTSLTYTLTVTNNGPASATNVTATDTLPSTVTYLSSTTTQGSCSEAGATVSCLLGTMANAATATITILTIPGQPGIVTNTATVSADQTDSNTSNNSATQTETIAAPTQITLRSLRAYSTTGRSGSQHVVLTWNTGGEVHNLGFSVYREQNGNRVRLNPSMIAGSALLMRGALPKHAGRRYMWMDPSAPAEGTPYWLEDIDVNGTRTMHGPVFVSGSASANEATPAETRMLSQLNQAQPASSDNQQSHVIEAFAPTSVPSREQMQKQFELAAHPAVKIEVAHEGWYRVGQPQLVRAGLDPNIDPASLHLYAEAIEQPITITGATAGPGGFGPQAAINFYGTGIDTEFSGTRVYFLTAGEGRGTRIPVLPPSSGSNQPPANYLSTVELQQHLIYFSALLTSNGQNFFGAIVSPTPVDQMLDVPHLNTSSSQTSRLEISLQGAIVGFPHDVSVTLNGTPIGNVLFNGQDKGVLKANIPPGALLSGTNTVTLTAQDGDYDTSLVDYIRITYPHAYVADADELKFTGRAGDEITVSDFASVPTVLDITDPNHPLQLTPDVNANNGKYSISLQVPFNTITAGPQRHTLLAVGGKRITSSAGVWPNHPSQWHSVQPGAEIAMVTDPHFATSLEPLVKAHQLQGKTSAIISVSDLYDEFTFGQHSPFAIQRFLQMTKQNWKRPPTYLLLNGRASLDPRNYLGFGYLDLVPTRIVPTASLMTASDDWFSDFNNTGMPTIATGRLPVSTADESTSVVAKIVSYETRSSGGTWTGNALMVADKDDTESFTQDSLTVQAQLPATMQATDTFVDSIGTAAAKLDITTAINSGELLVNYFGHGSEEQWSGTDIFDTSAVDSLTNGSELPVFMIMDCLNGFFQDVYAQPLGVTLLLAPNGGAAAVVASSGVNQPAPQNNLDTMVVQNAFASKGMTLGEALVGAKSKISDTDVRRTFVLFGDPAMKVKQPGAN